MKLMLEYNIRNRRTRKFHSSKTIEITVEQIVDGVRDCLAAPIHLDMEDEYEFCDFELHINI